MESEEKGASPQDHNEEDHAKVAVDVGQGEESIVVEVENQPSHSDHSHCEKVNITPKQDKLQSELCNVLDRVNELNKKKDTGMLTEEERTTLNKEKKRVQDLKKELQKVKNNQARQKKYRENFKRKLEELDEDSKKKIKTSTKGRPSKIEDENLLHKAIVNIAIGGSAADERRRSEVIRTVKTLDDLTAALQKQGFALSRSSVYLRLLPRNSLSHEGKRHINTVPVKLMRSENNIHLHHPDTSFARASISYLEELASLLGPDEVTFQSQDDKARVPIGITAANKQAPLVMHMEYKIRLSDHDFVVAPRHKLVPSVIAAIEIKKNSIGKQGVTYSGPTYVGIRSAKHSSSSAKSHLQDMSRINTLPEFKEYLYTPDGLHKPVMINTVDGGPDENPRYPKVIACAVEYFITHNLDALFVATNAPGRSAFNRVERRMAPLSHDLAGVVLPQDHFGSHLNSQGKTIDSELEQKNFAYAGKILGEIWSGTVIDGHPTIAEYVDEEEEVQISEKDPFWHTQHVQESQYLLQIVKCSDRACCEQPRSSYFSVIKERFLPPPLPLLQTTDGLCSAVDDSNAQFSSLFINLALGKSVLPTRATRRFPKCIPYDYACPSLQADLPKRVCGACGKYFASMKSMKAHLDHCHEKSGSSGSNEIKPNSIRPKRVAARRQRELMCLINYIESDEFEWHDEGEVDTTGLEIPGDIYYQEGTPVMPIEDRQQIWEDDI